MSPTTTPSPALALAAFVAASLVTLAYGDQPDIRYETAHLRIGTGFDEPLCQGDLGYLKLVYTPTQGPSTMSSSTQS